MSAAKAASDVLLVPVASFMLDRSAVRDSNMLHICDATGDFPLVETGDDAMLRSER
jgi:hypothetical protein